MGIVMSYRNNKSLNFKGIQGYTLKAVAAGVILSLSSGVYAACDYTAGDDFDNDSIANLQDGAPCDADLQKITINHIINGNFEAGANFWAPISQDASYSEVISFDASKAIAVTTTKNNKGLAAPDMQADGINSITVSFWAKAITVNDHSTPLKVKLTLKAEDGSLNGKGKPTTDKFLTPVFIDNIDDADLTDEVIIYNAAEWTPISYTFDLTAIQAEAVLVIADPGPEGGLTNGTKIALDAEGNYNDIIKLQIQPAKAGDEILIDNITLYTNKDKAAMLANAITDTDDDGLMNDVDAHPTQAYFTETKPSDDFDGDGIINSDDTHPYSITPATDLNNDGYDDATAPLTNILASSANTLEFTDAEQDNWDVVKFASSKDAKIGDTSYKVTNTATSKANIITIAATEHVAFGFWAKTDTAGFTTGEAFTVKARLIAANADASDIHMTTVLDDTNLTDQWQYFQVDKNLDETQTAADVEIILLKPSLENVANIWIDGITLFADADADALAATSRDTDSDGINDFWDNDDDNDGLLDGEDAEPLNIAIGSFEAPDIDHDGNADIADNNENGILDFYEVITVPDTTAPEIILNGDASITITQGDEYTDLGASASDDIDGDITANVTTVGGVDIFTVGTYTFSYNVSDNAGNVAAEVTRTIIVEPIPEGGNILKVTAPDDITQEATSTNTSLTLTEPTITNSNSEVTTTVSNDAPEAFSVGETIVTWTVVDSLNNSKIVDQKIIITDTVAPVFQTLSDITFDKSTAGSEVTLTAPTASDAVDGEITATTSFKNGVYQPGNTYEITWIATDAAGNSSEITQNLTVTAALPVIEEVESKGGSFSFAGLFLMIGLIARRLITNK